MFLTNTLKIGICLNILYIYIYIYIYYAVLNSIVFVLLFLKGTPTLVITRKLLEKGPMKLHVSSSVGQFVIMPINSFSQKLFIGIF